MKAFLVMVTDEMSQGHVGIMTHHYSKIYITFQIENYKFMVLQQAPDKK